MALFSGVSTALGRSRARARLRAARLRRRLPKARVGHYVGLVHPFNVESLRKELWSKELIHDAVAKAKSLSVLPLYDINKTERELNMKKKFFILWSPESNLPPRKRFETRKEAEDVARIMTERYPQQTFCVCMVVSVTKVQTHPIKTTALK